MTYFEYKFMKRKEKRERGIFRSEIPRIIIPEKLSKNLPKKTLDNAKKTADLVQSGLMDEDWDFFSHASKASYGNDITQQMSDIFSAFHSPDANDRLSLKLGKNDTILEVDERGETP
jgi:hypothetical protein